MTEATSTSFTIEDFLEARDLCASRKSGEDYSELIDFLMQRFCKPQGWLGCIHGSWDLYNVLGFDYVLTPQTVKGVTIFALVMRHSNNSGKPIGIEIAWGHDLGQCIKLVEACYQRGLQK